MLKTETSRAHFTERRRAPQNLKPQDAALFANAMQGEFPVDELMHLRDAEVFGRSPIRRADGTFLAQSFVSEGHYQQWRRERGHWRANIERVIHHHTALETPAIWITDNWSCGYFHWFGDTLPRLEFALRDLSAADLTLLLPHKFHRHPFFLESLDAYGLKAVKILGRFEGLRCKTLFLSPHVAPTGNYRSQLMHSMRSRFRRHAKGLPANGSRKRIYISRGLAGRRRIANEDQILPVLAEHGFQTVFAEKTCWAHQVQLAASAEWLISNHGAGLTNMLAMDAGTKVMEIRERHDAHNNCFFSLASALNLEYFYLLADRQDPRQCVHRADLIVDPNQLDEFLTSVLDSARCLKPAC